MLPALNKIAASQYKQTIHTNIATDMLLDYAQTYHNAKVCYHASDMILNVESDATYLFMPGYHSCIDGYYYLSDHTTNPTNHSDVNTNGLILAECNTLKVLVVSASESDTGRLFING